MSFQLLIYIKEVIVSTLNRKSDPLTCMAEKDEISELVEKLDKLSLNDRNEVFSKIHKQGNPTIVVTGQTGVGNSTSVRSLLGKGVGKVHLGPASRRNTKRKY